MKFPYIDLKIKQNENATEIIYSYETWIRVKRKDVWYEVRVFDKYTVNITNKTFEVVNNVILNNKSFIKLCHNVINCIVITEDKIKKEKHNYKISNTQIEEEDRMYIKNLVDFNQIHSIL